VEATKKFFAAFKKISTYRVLKLNVENQLPTCKPELKLSNEVLMNNESSLQNALEKVVSYVTLFFSPSTGVSRNNLLFAVKRLHMTSVTIRDLLKGPRPRI